MATKLYHTRIHIELEYINNPDYVIRLDNHITSAVIIRNLTPGPHTLTIEHRNKDPVDPDTALIIRSITFNDITSDKFLWAGVYTPNYPEPWASTQTDLQRELTNTNYLGWNGIWRLEFTAPIFTWIHQLENLGWIYD